MEYASGRSLTGAGNCVVELKSLYVLGTLVYVYLLRSNLTYTTLLNEFNDRWLMVSTLLNAFSVLHHIKIDTWLAYTSGCNISKWQKLHNCKIWPLILLDKKWLMLYLLNLDSCVIKVILSRFLEWYKYFEFWEGKSFRN